MKDRYIPAQLAISHTPAVLSVESTNIRCVIDSSECFAQEGHKTIGRLVSDEAAQGMDDLRQAVQNATDEVWATLEAPPHADTIREQAMAKAVGSMQDAELTFIPSVRPTISWVPNSLSISFQPRQMHVDWQTTNTPDVQLQQRGSVRYWMAQYPSIDIEYVGGGSPHGLDERA